MAKSSNRKFSADFACRASEILQFKSAVLAACKRNADFIIRHSRCTLIREVCNHQLNGFARAHGPTDVYRGFGKISVKLNEMSIRSHDTPPLPICTITFGCFAYFETTLRMHSKITLTCQITVSSARCSEFKQACSLRDVIVLRRCVISIKLLYINENCLRQNGN